MSTVSRIAREAAEMLLLGPKCCAFILAASKRFGFRWWIAVGGGSSGAWAKGRKCNEKSSSRSRTSITIFTESRNNDCGAGFRKSEC